MDLLAEAKTALDDIAPGLRPDRLAKMTLAIHHAFERLAYRYADSAKLAYGPHGRTHPDSANPGSSERLMVCSSKPRIMPKEDYDGQGGFLLDQCWLTYHNSRADDQDGRFVRCEFALESELGPFNNFAFFQDFRKLLVTKAPKKVFVFRSRTENEREDTFQTLVAEAGSFDAKAHPAESYLLCGWHKARSSTRRSRRVADSRPSPSLRSNLKMRGRRHQTP